MDTLQSLFSKYLSALTAPQDTQSFDIKACYDEVVFRQSIADNNTANEILTFTFNGFK
jgi:hypothetical protein